MIPRVKVRVIKRTSRVPLSLAQAFQFFSNPHSVVMLTPSVMQFRLVGNASETIKPGTVLDYRFRFYRIPLRWRVRIDSVEAPNSFEDAQEKGPFGHWRHTQMFLAQGETTTEIRDRFEFGLPFGRVGEFVYRMFVKTMLRQMFDYRADKIDLLMHHATQQFAGARTNPTPTSAPQV